MSLKWAQEEDLRDCEQGTKLLKRCAILIFAAFVIHFIVYLCEIVHLRTTLIKDFDKQLALFLWYMLFLFIFTVMSFVVVFPDEPDDNYRGKTVGCLIYSFLYLLFYFNPWILELQWNGILSTLKHIPPLQVIIFPIIIISLWFSALVNWRVGSVKDDKEDNDKEDSEKKSKVKKIPKAPSRKTLGMRNKTWISLCINLIIIVGSFWVVMIILEIIVTGKKFIKFKTDDIVLSLQGFAFIDVIVLFPMIYDCLKDKYKKDTPECYRKQALFTGLSTVFIFFYFFNPWTLECFRTAQLYYEYFLFFSIVELFGIPILLVSLSFYTWIYWRMSKVKPDYDGDEPYLVIYGGKDSSTKMIIVE